jgi:metal-responsive CopG/Arc/MetJ family transcriptional regulator
MQMHHPLMHMHQIGYDGGMRTTITLPDPLFQNAKRVAEEQGTNLSGLVEEALRTFIARKPARSRTPFRLHTVRGVLVNPSVDLDRTSSLITADDEAEFQHGK